MTTEAQINANRANAQKSTGPRTPEGKEKAAQNALKHGLLAKDVVVGGEDLDQFELLRDQLRAELAPVGLTESLLAERIAGQFWRLQRAERFHTESFDVMYAQCRAEPLTQRWQAAQGPEQSDPAFGLTVIKDFSQTKVLERLMVYERRIENSLYRTMAELRQVQGRRQGAAGVPQWDDRRRRSRAEEDRGGPFHRVPETLPPDFTLDNLLAKIAALEDNPADATTNLPADPSCETKPISQLRIADGGLRIQDSPAAGCSLPPDAPGPRRTVVQTNPIGPSQSCETSPISPAETGPEDEMRKTKPISEEVSNLTRQPSSQTCKTNPISGGASSRPRGYTPIFRRRR